MNPVVAENVTFHAAGAVDRATGLLGFVEATINGLVIDGLTIRRGLSGNLYLGFPRHTDRHGRDHVVVRPANAAVSEAMKKAVFAALGSAATASLWAQAQGESS